MGPSKKISVVTGCLNERDNIEEYYARVTKAMAELPGYSYDVIIADNYSTDGTRDILRKIAAADTRVKVLFNSRNFGPICSGYNAFLLATGDAAILMACDLQEPPEMIPEMVRKWEAGYKVVVAVKSASQEHGLKFFARRCFYRALNFLSDKDELINNFSGYGLYDRAFLRVLQRYPDPVPYFRGFVSEVGFRRAEIPFEQPARKHGKSKLSLFSLYDIAIGGLINHSKLPLRLATLSGFCLAGFSLLVAAGYFIYKLLYWDTFTVGVGPMVIGVFFFSAVQLIFIGIIGEYVGAVLTQVKSRPFAVVEETLNMPNPDA